MSEAMASEHDNPASPAPFRDPEPFSHSAQGIELTFYPSGVDRLAALLGMIQGARRSLKLFFYIFAIDSCAAAVRDALAEAAGRGVSVTLILDDYGSTADDDFLSSLIEAGGKVQRFSARWNARYLIRNHQKMLIADGEAALIGGFNVEQSYFDPPEKDGWNDLAIRVEGEAAARLAEWFDLLEGWTAGHDVKLGEARRQVRAWNAGSGAVRWLLGGPSQRLSPWARSVITDIEKARRLDMMVAYFSPRRGVVRRMAAKSDNAATIGAARALYGTLLRGGAGIYEFEPCKLHAKLIVVDDAVYIGSANFDMRSLYINVEIMLRVEDAALADRMREFIAYHLPYATHVTPALHRRRRTWWNRLRWSLSWFLVAVVDYTVTRRLNLGLGRNQS